MPEPLKPLDLPDWFSKPHRNPDYCDPCCDDSEAVIKWNLQHVGLLEKLVQDQAAEIKRLRASQEMDAAAIATKSEWTAIVQKFEASIIAHQGVISNGHDTPRLFAAVENLRSILINSFDPPPSTEETR